MTFASDLKAFARKVETRNRDIFVGVVSEVKRSIAEGSELTGSPGQPVDEGILKASFHESFESPTVATITTNVAYARQIEDGVRDGKPLTLRSQVGGFHSIAHTKAGLPRIVEHVTKAVVGRG